MFPLSNNDFEDQYKTREQLIVELRELRGRMSDQGRNEDALREALKWFEAIFENTPHVAIQGFDTDGVVTHWNSASRQTYGYTSKEAKGRRLQDLILAGEAAGEFEELLRQICRTGQPMPGRQWEVIDKDGQKRWVYSTMFPVFDRGSVAEVFCMDVDITERIRIEEELKQAHNELESRVTERTEAFEKINESLLKEIAMRKEIETALSRSETFLENIFDCIDDGITIMDNEMNIIAVNNSMQKKYSSSAPLIDKKCYAVYRNRDTPCDNCPGVRAIAEGTMQAQVMQYNKGGTQGWREIFSFPLRDGCGETMGVISQVRDITQRKRIEEELDLERSQLLSIFDSIDEVIYVSDPYTNEILYANRAMKERFKKDLVGDICYKAIHDSSAPCEFCNNREILKNEGKPCVWEFFNRIVGRHYSITDRIIKWPDGRDVRFEIAIDITDRKKGEDELVRAKSEAELYVDLMGHDINNMNQVGIGYLELADDLLKSEGKLDEENLMLLAKPLESLKNSSRLIDNVRKIQRQKHGGYTDEIIDINDVLMDLIPKYVSSAERDVTINYMPVEGCYAKANVLLKDVFLNLIGNAVKHSTDSLTINIELEKVVDHGREFYMVAIEDNGPGIPDSLKKTLFDRLNLASTRAQGKGFGLCLIKMLVDDYDGIFRVEDRVPGNYREGARFVVMFPAV